MIKEKEFYNLDNVQTWALNVKCKVAVFPNSRKWTKVSRQVVFPVISLPVLFPVSRILVAHSDVGLSTLIYHEMLSTSLLRYRRLM